MLLTVPEMHPCKSQWEIQGPRRSVEALYYRRVPLFPPGQHPSFAMMAGDYTMGLSKHIYAD